MTDFSKIFALSKLANLKERTLELARDRVVEFCVDTPHTPTDSADMRIINAMLTTELSTGDFDLYRRQLLILPLASVLQKINDHFADSFNSASAIAQWNDLVGDLLITTYGDFSDFLLGNKWVHGQRQWIDLEPPHPDLSARAAKELYEMLGTLTRRPFSKLLNEANKSTIIELAYHLRPHIHASFIHPITFNY